MRPWRGMTSLGAVAVLAVAAAGLAWVAFSLRQTERTLQRSSHRIEDRSRAQTTVAKLLAGLEKNWDQSREPWYDFAAAFPVEEGTQLTVGDLSGRLNLNNANRFLWTDSSLGGTLTKGVGAFLSYRTTKGPFVSRAAYADYVSAQPLDRWYSVLPVFSLATVDEDVFRKIVADYGRPESATLWTDNLRRLRERKATLTQGDLGAVFGNDQDTLGVLFSTSPELNAQTAPEGLLGALFHYSALAIPEPDTRLQALLAARDRGRLTTSSLLTTVDLPVEHRLWAYLGVESRFLEGTVSTGTVILEFIVWRQPSAAGDHFRLLRQSLKEQE